MFTKITEATVTIEAPTEEKISSKLPVFYNPAMKLNRDISILLLKAIDDQDMQICDLMAGTGIRSIRFLAELEKKIKSITINDYDEQATELIRKNIKANKSALDPAAEINITNKDASTLLLESTGFDYIDVDPFGTPNPFLDAAARRLSREGILAVTATDTSALAGTFPKACQRKYWAVPNRGPLKHEIGIRILIRKVQLIAAQYSKALTPIFSYSKEHYMRVFFRCKKGKSPVDKILKKQGMMHSAGPMWLGALWDPNITEKIFQLSADLNYDTNLRLLSTIRDESKIAAAGFHDIHNISKRYKLIAPAFTPVMQKIEEAGHSVARTHFSDHGIRSTISEEELVDIIMKIRRECHTPT
ncbi:methyltransferase [Candidatus Woesearchaeota archaeon]|nr:methyltransferase [Candidatus Woesearchaeota archaeon]